MKKYIIGMTIASAIFMAACGSEEAEQGEKGTEKEEVSTEETAAASTDETIEEEVEEEEPAEETDSENVLEDEDLRVEDVYTDKELNITGTTGPIEYSVDAIQFKKILVKSEYAAEMFEVEVGDNVEGFTIQFTGENTAEEDISFYLGQATIVTNTKEQLEPDFFLSEYIDGEYLGAVRHTGFNFYKLQNSSVDELESLEVRVEAPFDTNWDDVGEAVSETITIER